MSQPTQDWKDNFLCRAVKRLYESDQHLIKPGKERPAAARLACHLRDVLVENGYLTKFPNIRIDVEYGREGNDVKRNSKGNPVRPDIIVHVPGKEGPNVAVVEVKGYWNSGSTGDRDKLKNYQDNQGYAFAYFMKLEENAPSLEKIK